MNELQVIQNIIYEVRGRQVMLDFDLAQLYQVETRVLNQAVKRNIERFPEDFMFQLTDGEWTIISSQFVMTSQNDINEDTQVQLTAINQALAELSVSRRADDKPRRSIGFIQHDAS